MDVLDQLENALGQYHSEATRLPVAAVRRDLKNYKKHLQNLWVLGKASFEALYKWYYSLYVHIRIGVIATSDAAAADDPSDSELYADVYRSLLLMTIPVDCVDIMEQDLPLSERKCAQEHGQGLLISSFRILQKMKPIHDAFLTTCRMRSQDVDVLHAKVHQVTSMARKLFTIVETKRKTESSKLLVEEMEKSRQWMKIYSAGDAMAQVVKYYTQSIRDVEDLSKLLPEPDPFLDAWANQKSTHFLPFVYFADECYNTLVENTATVNAFMRRTLSAMEGPIDESVVGSSEVVHVKSANKDAQEELKQIVQETPLNMEGELPPAPPLTDEDLAVASSSSLPPELEEKKERKQEASPKPSALREAIQKGMENLKPLKQQEQQDKVQSHGIFGKMDQRLQQALAARRSKIEAEDEDPWEEV